MMPLSFASTSSLLHEYLIEFWLISKPDVATPPALEALPGPNKIPALWNAPTASGVEGIFAPSATSLQPFLIKAFASSPLSSFCVAQGNAQSTLTDQGLSFAVNFAEGYFVTYSLILPRLTFFI